MEQNQQIARSQQALRTTEMRVQKLEEELRMERIKQYGPRSEKLSDLQLQLLDLEPAVSSNEVKGESESGPLPESTEASNTADKQRRSRQNHPGRNVLPGHLERVVVLMDGLFAIDREAREQTLSLDDRHALRQERAPVILTELHALLLEMQQPGSILPESAAGQAISYTLNRWEKLTRFIEHPVIELSTNWAENSMRPISIGRRNWLHLGSKEAGPKIAAIFSIVESCRKLDVPIRKYLADVLPGLADRSIQSLAELTPTAYAAKAAK